MPPRFSWKGCAARTMLSRRSCSDRARGDNGPDSDLDLAVVLGGRRGDFMGTRLDMAGTAFDAMLETGVLVQAFPLWDDDLAHPERFTNPALIRTIAKHGIRLG